MNDSFYPSLYTAASNASADGQKYFLNFVKIEYLFLVSASILMLPFSEEQAYLALVAFVFMVLIAVTLWRAFSGPDRNWYNGRAVAESVKTLTWRYAMCAEPFQKQDGNQEASSRFRYELQSLLTSNKELGKALASHTDTGDQITIKMNELRLLGTNDRLAYYTKHRIDDQRSWYAKKAKYNSRSYKFWMIVILFVYGMGVAAAMGRIVLPETQFWPIDTLVVFSGCALGWMQIKKFNELSAAYSLTAAEIGLIKTRIAEVRTEADFIEFVKDSEFAFSREHTQWIARQSS